MNDVCEECHGAGEFDQFTETVKCGFCKGAGRAQAAPVREWRCGVCNANDEQCIQCACAQGRANEPIPPLAQQGVRRWIHRAIAGWIEAPEGDAGDWVSSAAYDALAKERDELQAQRRLWLDTDNNAYMIAEQERAITRLESSLAAVETERDRLTSELTAARAAREWQPIETLKREGSVVMYCDAHGNRWTDIDDGASWAHNGCGYPPTHWLPLPPPPSREGGDE